MGSRYAVARRALGTHPAAQPRPNAERGSGNAEPALGILFRVPRSAFYVPRSALASAPQALRQIFGELVGRDANLLECVPIAHRHGAVLRGLTVDRDAERRAGLVLAAIAATDRAAVVVEGVVVLPQIVEDAARQPGHPILVHQRKHR